MHQNQNSWFWGFGFDTVMVLMVWSMSQDTLKNTIFCDQNQNQKFWSQNIVFFEFFEAS
jgi:hypothetical protein